MKQRFFALYAKSGRPNDYDFYEYGFGTWHDVLINYMKQCTQPCYIVEQVKEDGLWRDVVDADGQPIILKTKNWEKQK